MDTIIKNSRAPALTDGNRYYQLITPASPREVIKLAHMGCIGDTVISNIQLEQGTVPSAYEAPVVKQNELSGIFKAIQGIRVQMSDKESDLWSDIVANNQALLAAYHKDTVSASIGVSADQIRQEVKDTLDGKQTDFTQNLNGFRARVKDEITESTVTQLADLYDRKFEAVDGNYSRLTQTVDGFNQAIRDNETDTESKLMQLAQLLQSKVSSTDFMTTIRQNADSIALALNGKVSGQMSGPEIISTINITTGGVGIYSGSNKLVVAPETTYIQNGTIESAMIKELDASKLTAESITSDKLASNAVTAGKIQAGSVQTIHLQAKAVTGDKILFDQAFFNNLTANTVVSGTTTTKQLFATSVQAIELSADKITSGILSAKNGAMQINLDQAKVSFNQNAMIEFNSANNALVRRKGYYTAFLHFNDVSDGSLYAGLGVTSTGDGINSQSSGRFAGIRIFRSSHRNGADHGALTDEVQVYGDVVKIRHAFNESTGWTFPVANGLSGKEINMGTLAQAVRAVCAMMAHSKNTNFTVNNDWLRMWAIEQEHIDRGMQLI